MSAGLMELMGISPIDSQGEGLDGLNQ